MSLCPELEFIREDPVSKITVFAGHPDEILPRQLSARLMNIYGSGNYRISLQRNVYVIYIGEARDGGLGIQSLKQQDYRERSRDVRMAKKLLMCAEETLTAGCARKVY